MNQKTIKKNYMNEMFKRKKEVDVKNILPYSVVLLELTNFCNMNCDFCPSSKMGRKRGYMDTDLAKMLISEISKDGISKIIVFHVMGEALLHPDVFEIINYANSKGLDTQLNTNGILLTRENTRKILESGLSRLGISYVTPTNDLYEHRGTGFPFSKYKENIEYFIKEYIKYESDIRVVILMGVTYPRTIYERISSIIEPTHIKLIENSQDFEIQKDNILRLCETKEEIEVIPRYYSKWGIDGKYKSTIGSCLSPFHHFSILWNGDITICDLDYNGEGVVGNVKSNKLLEILNNQQMIKLREGLKKNRLVASVCRKCRSKENIISSFIYQTWNLVK